ncbi:MAG: DNA polymerase III subunit delta' [Cellulosilyticum sp.]|nr:DNA polymerase III subunit delta' [Cellulosilyticum sp.]
MEVFEDIIGNQDAKTYFKKAVLDNQLSHSYIFEGPYGVGKNTFALELAKFILCENKEGIKPCNECRSCHMINAGTHPDVIQVEKDNKVTKVETIRENIVREMDIKPYQSDYKIIIVKAADSMSIQGQNAMLKTIEEPPAYGIIILVCENLTSLLPTIKSRCIVVRFNPINKEQMRSYLTQKGINGIQREVYEKLSDGSIGVINDIMHDETYMEVRKQSIKYLERLDKAQIMEIYDIVKEITDQKEEIERILQFWLYWYRDIAIVKATNNRDLYYKDCQQQLLDMSYKLTYNKVSQNIESIKLAILDIKQNIYSTFVIENLLLQLKERKK